MSVLSATSLSKRFRKRTVVHDVSLNVYSGEIVGLLGPNGAGKTTSFHMIVGLISCDKGSIVLNDQEISMLPMDKRARMGLGYLPQESSIFRKLTVADNIKAILETQKHLGEEQAATRLEHLLQEFHVEHLRDNLGMSLSGGERRRVEIARALAGIDPISVSDIQRITRYLAQMGFGILITDHNVRETLGSCDRAYIVNDGHIIKEGTPDEILADEKVRAVYLGEQFRL